MIRPSADDPVVRALVERCFFGESEHHDVAVSGGADSVALLALAVATGAPVTAHHVDHGTRAGTDGEVELVSDLCDSWGARLVSHRVEVHPGPNLEGRWREARRAVLPRSCKYGHTADDQAETVLLRLMRGTGPSGLAAMDPRTHPILALRRSETAGLCGHLEVQVFSDPTNESNRFARNRVRREVLPLLSEISGRDVVPLLARTAELAALERDQIEAAGAGIDPTDCAAVAELPEVIAVVVLRAWWNATTGGLPAPDRTAMRRMLDVVHHTSRSCEVTAGWTLARTGGRLRLESDSARV